MHVKQGEGDEEQGGDGGVTEIEAGLDLAECVQFVRVEVEVVTQDLLAHAVVGLKVDAMNGAVIPTIQNDGAQEKQANFIQIRHSERRSGIVGRWAGAIN